METTATKSITVQAIVDGTFAKSGTGNFNGRSTAGTRFHISKPQMDKLKMNTPAKFKPFFAIVTTNEYNELVKEDHIADESNPYFGKSDALNKPYKDADGNVKTFIRDEATAVFLTNKEANDAKRMSQRSEAEADHEDKVISIKRQIELNELAKDNGLTIEAMKALAGASL